MATVGDRLRGARQRAFVGRAAESPSRPRGHSQGIVGGADLTTDFRYRPARLPSVFGS